MEATEQVVDNAPAEAPQDVPIIRSDGMFKDDWYEKYGEENAPTLSRIKNFDDFVNTHMSQRKMIGKDPSSLVEIPNEHSTEDVRNNFRSKALGVADEEAYEYDLDPEVKEVIGDLDPEKMSVAKKFFREELELSPDKYKKVMEFYTKMTADDTKSFMEKTAAQKELDRQTGWQLLQKERGDSLEEDKLYADQITLKYGMREWIKNNGHDNDPEFAKILMNIGRDIAPSRLKGLNSSTQPSTEQVDAQIAELRSDPGYNDISSPKHKTLNAKVEALYQKKYTKG